SAITPLSAPVAAVCASAHGAPIQIVKMKKATAEAVLSGFMVSSLLVVIPDHAYDATLHALGSCVEDRPLE
ncbi:MAG: hypothetical protein L0312_29620, partial [Acidobacteria bacterium]|nr:hypothetical protein [Acidobacteriota bacterium]